MQVTELNKDQLKELKQRYYDTDESYDKTKVGVSYSELININDIVSDKDIFKAYEGYEFSNDDFLCTMGKYSVKELREEAKNNIDYTLSELYLITKERPESDDILGLSQLANGLEQTVCDLRQYVKDYEDAVREGV